MDSSILSELVIIRWLLIVLLSLGVIFFLFALATILGNRRALVAASDTRMRDLLIAETQMYESKGDNLKFLEKAEAFVNLYPEDLIANWYYALSNYKNDHLGTALSSLKHIKQTDPAWNKETVNEYIETIESKMSESKNDS